MKLLISLSVVAPNRDPELILQRIANTVDRSRSRNPNEIDYRTGGACWSRVAQYIRDNAPLMRNMKLSDRILMYGSAIDYDPGETAHVCLYSEEGHMRVDTMAIKGKGMPMREGKPGAYKRYYYIPPKSQPQLEKRSRFNYMLLKSITLLDFFEQYFTEAPFRLGIKR